jgi:tetratricopeptide (TPR) repeat protein
MHRKLRNLAVAAACFLGFAVAACAQVSGVEGTVKDAQGNPIVGAVVKIDRKDIKGSYNVKTDKKGHYGHYGLPLGTYKITVLVEDKPIDQMDNVRTRLGDPQNINFQARPQQAAQQQAGGQQQPPPEANRSMSKEQKAEYEKANKAREEAIAKNKALNEAFSGGKTAMEAKDYDTAITQFQKASEMDPSQTVIWSNLADAYISASKAKPTEANDLRQKGIEAYKKAIEIKPDDATFYNNMALALALQKQIPEAQAALEKAATLDPPGAGRYYYNLGAVLVNTGQNEPAGQAFKKAIDADPTYADAQYQYGITLTAQAKTEANGKITPVPGTIEAFQKYLDLKPDGPFADSAKQMIQMLGGTVTTGFSNPNAPKSTPAKKKK